MEIAGIINWTPDRRGQNRILFLTVLAVVALALLHYATGPDHEFHIFFLLPVIAASWYAGPRAGWLVSMVSILLWLMADLQLVAAGGRPVTLFNEVARLSVLLVAAHLAARLRQVNLDLERRVAERTAELARANETLVRSNLELQRFNFIASHDLQTPLRSIVGFAQLLQRDYQGRLDAQADELIHRVVENTRRMHALLRDMAAYSSLDARGPPFEAVDLGQALHAAQRALAPSIAESGAEVNAGPLPTVAGDPGQLALLFQHLVDNGIKFRGEAPPRIEVEARREGEEWLFSVRDNGIGIAPGQRERIFAIFHRLHSHGAYPGTGVGLALSRRIVERHGGRIWVEPADRGCEIRFTLPARPAP